MPQQQPQSRGGGRSAKPHQQRRQHRDPHAATTVNDEAEAPHTPSAFKNENQARLQATAKKIPYPVVEKIGFVCATMPLSDDDDDDDDRRDAANDWLGRLKVELDAVRTSRPDALPAVEAVLCDLPAARIPKESKAIREFIHAQITFEHPSAAAAAAATSPTSGRPEIEMDTFTPQDPELVTAINLELGVQFPDLQIPPLLGKPQRVLILDAYRKHEVRVREAHQRLREVTAPSTDPASTEEAARLNDNIEAHRGVLCDLVEQTGVFQRVLERLPDHQAEGKAACERECRRLLAHLPALQSRDEINRCVAETGSPAFIVVGATGSGKSTQVPQLLAERLIDLHHVGKFSKQKRVICTQPRRMAALALTSRVAQEWGNDQEVGCDAGASGDVHDGDRIRYMTEFAFLQRITPGARQPRERHIRPQDIFAVVVDEAHERSIQGDIIIGHMYYLITRVREWQHVKLVISSATIDEKRFRERLPKLDGADASLVSIPGRTFPVDVRYASFLDQVKPGCDDVDSSSSDDDEDQDDRVSTKRIVPRLVTAVKQTLQQMTCQSEDPLVIADEAPRGDILCFLPAAPDAADAAQQLKRALGHRLYRDAVSVDAVVEEDEDVVQLGDADDDGDSDTSSTSSDSSGTPQHEFFVEIVELSGRMTPKEQQAILKPHHDSRCIRVICATPVAETSITIPSVTVVIDTGLARVSRFNAAKRVMEVIQVPISKQSAQQRQGRAGRTQPGVCIRLYEQVAFEHMSAGKTCALLESPIEGACLRVLQLNGCSPASFHWIDAPDSATIAAGMLSLQRIGAITSPGGDDQTASLTEFGNFACRLNLADVRLASVLFGLRHRPTALHAAMLSVAVLPHMGFWWRRPPSEAASVADARRRQASELGADVLGDLAVAVRILSVIGDTKCNPKTRAETLDSEHVNRGTAVKVIQSLRTLEGDLARVLGGSGGGAAAGRRAAAAAVPWRTPSQLQVVEDVRAYVLPLLITALEDQVMVLQSTFGHYQSAAYDFEAIVGRSSVVHAGAEALALAGATANRQRVLHQDFRARAREVAKHLPRVILYLSIVSHESSRAMRMSGIIPLCPLGADATIATHAVQVSDATRSRIIDLLNAQWREVICEPVPTLFVRRWRSREVTEACARDDATTATIRAFVDRDDGSGQPVLRVSCRSDDPAGETRARAFLKKSHDALTEACSEQPVAGEQRILLGRGGVPVQVLDGATSFTSLMIPWPPEYPPPQKVRLMNDFPSATAVEIQTRANMKTPMVLVHFPSPEAALKAHKHAEVVGTYNVQPRVRISSPSPSAVVVQGRFHLRLWIREETLPDDSGDGPPARTAVDPKLVNALRAEVIAVLSEAGVQNPAIHYDNDKGRFDARGFTTPDRAEQLRVAFNALDFIEGHAKVQGYADFACRIGCDSKYKPLVNKSVRQILPRGLLATPTGPRCPWVEIVGHDRRTLSEAVHSIEKLVAGVVIDVFAHCPQPADAQPRALVYETKTGIKALKRKIAPEGALERWGPERNVIVDVERQTLTLFGAVHEIEEETRDIVEVISQLVSVARTRDTICASRRWMPMRNAKDRKRVRNALKKAFAPFGTLPEDVLQTSLDDLVESFDRTTVTIIAPREIVHALDAVRPRVLQDPGESEGSDDIDVDDDMACPVCCMACIEPFILSSCCHRICTRCFFELTNQLPVPVPIKCLKCHAVCSMHDVLLVNRRAAQRCAEQAASTIKNGDMQAFANDWISCPNARCSGVVERHVRSTVCSACYSVCCAECAELYPGKPVAPHRGRTCREVHDAELARANEDAHKAKVADLMLVKCPRCNAAFLDFDGCYALVCDQCKCGFCGFCMKDCGADAHQHVPGCTLNRKRSFFDAIDVFHRLRDKEKKERVEEYMRAEKLPAAVRRFVMNFANSLFNSDTSFVIDNDDARGSGPAAATDGDDAATASPPPQESGPRRIKRQMACDVPPQLLEAVQRLVAHVAALDTSARYLVADGDPEPPSLQQIAWEPAVRKHLKGMAQLVAKHWKVKTHPLLTVDQSTAITAYTDEGLYCDLNALLRSARSDDEIDALRGYMFHFLGGIRALPPSRPPFVYRGFDRAFNQAHGDKYTPGRCVSWKGISSVSTDKAVSQGFAKKGSGGGALFVMELQTGFPSVEKLSVYPNEAELIVPPRTVFEVTKVEPGDVGPGSRTIYLKQVA